MSFLYKHEKLEKNSLLLLVFIIVVVLIGGLVEIVPLFRLHTVIEPVKGVRPYTPLELTGQNIYIREGCYLCHSQQIRPLRDEVARYGHYSLAAESMYDHPFQWGSKRTGPDLARVGGKYSDEWHAAHLKNPRDVVPESIMPSYSFLAGRAARLHDIQKSLKALKAVGVPYTDEMIENALDDANVQASPTADSEDFLDRYPGANVREFDGDPSMTSEMDALVAYLQVLGTMVKFTDSEEIITPPADTTKASPVTEVQPTEQAPQPVETQDPVIVKKEGM